MLVCMLLIMESAKFKKEKFQMLFEQNVASNVT